MDAEIGHPAPGATALLIIDMINDLRFIGADAIRNGAERAAGAIARLRAEARDRDVPVIFVNDNFGQWHSERSRLVDYVAREESCGHGLLRQLTPYEDEYFIIKPQFSGFYASNLSVLLPKLGVTRLILTGIAADICVLFTAADAHMRAYDLWVPADTVAGESDQRTRWALETMKESMAAEIRPSTEFSLAAWLDLPPAEGATR